MRKIGLFLAVIAAGVLANAYVQPAFAQANRTWVSGVGDDVNDCSRTTPCKTFAGAYSKTATGGEINCLDPAGYGGLTITKSISIICDNVLAGVAVSGVDAFIVTVAATDKVILSGLNIQGAGAGLSGVKITGSGKIFVINSIISNFTRYGVEVVGTANAKVFIYNSQVTFNTLGGLLLQGQSGVTNFGIIEGSMFDSNGAASTVINAGGQLFVSGSSLTGATAAYSISGGTVTSYGDNVVRGSGTPTSTLPKS